MREISLTTFVAGYEKGYITEVVFVGNNVNRVYGRNVEGQGDNPDGFEIVWASVP